ncbi:MAG: hypothetical protein ABLQ96_03855 [Candidatus Acidiferrum sp.]
MNFSFELKPLFLSGLAILLLLFPGHACAQADNSQGQPGQEKPAEKKDDPADKSAGGPREQEQNQSPPEITAVPNRPTFSTTAEAVQRGVLEVEYGAELADGHQNINGLIKFGILKNLELRFANNPFVRDGGVSGLGDSGAGFKYRVLPQQGLRPTFSVLYTASISTSTGTPGIGATGHGVDILFSKDFGKHHFDFNEGVRFSGRPGAGGYDRNYFTAFDYAHPLPRKWGYALEIAGFSRANAATPASMVILLAATYNVSSRLVLDGGEYTAVYGNFPRATVFVGVTYSIADFYRVRHTIPAASRSH